MDKPVEERRSPASSRMYIEMQENRNEWPVLVKLCTEPDIPIPTKPYIQIRISYAHADGWIRPSAASISESKSKSQVQIYLLPRLMNAFFPSCMPTI
jgi:hypothetical protein